MIWSYSDQVFLRSALKVKFHWSCKTTLVVWGGVDIDKLSSLKPTKSPWDFQWLEDEFPFTNAYTVYIHIYTYIMCIYLCIHMCFERMVKDEVICVGSKKWNKIIIHLDCFFVNPCFFGYRWAAWGACYGRLMHLDVMAGHVILTWLVFMVRFSENQDVPWNSMIGR